MGAETSSPNKDTALGNQILRGVVGSTAHGTAVDGQDDRDEMGVFVEPAVNVCGLCDGNGHGRAIVIDRHGTNERFRRTA